MFKAIFLTFVLLIGVVGVVAAWNGWRMTAQITIGILVAMAAVGVLIMLVSVWAEALLGL